MRSNNVCEALSEIFIHQGMLGCLLAGCDAHIEKCQQNSGTLERDSIKSHPGFSSD